MPVRQRMLLGGTLRDARRGAALARSGPEHLRCATLAVYSAPVASAFTHAFAAAALGHVLVPRRPALWLLGALCAAAPDLDVIGFRLGISYGHLLGHRGLSHSLPFAALSAVLLSRPWRHATRAGEQGAPSTLRLWTYLFAAITSHGLLDALTNGGLGVAFFAPFDGERYFFPWQPIEVSPISVRRFFTARGWRVLQSELLVVWLPALLVMLLASGWRRMRSHS